MNPRFFAIITIFIKLSIVRKGADLHSPRRVATKSQKAASWSCVRCSIRRLSPKRPYFVLAYCEIAHFGDCYSLTLTLTLPNSISFLSIRKHIFSISIQENDVVGLCCWYLAGHDIVYLTLSGSTIQHYKSQAVLLTIYSVTVSMLYLQRHIYYLD